MAAAPGLGPGVRKNVWVQIPPSLPNMKERKDMSRYPSRRKIAKGLAGSEQHALEIILGEMETEMVAGLLEDISCHLHMVANIPEIPDFEADDYKLKSDLIDSILHKMVKIDEGQIE